MSDKAEKKYERFVKAYVIERNATKAAIAAGYSKNGAAVSGNRLLKNAKVQQLLSNSHQQIVTKLEQINDITIERVMKELARIAFLDPRKFFDKDGKLIPLDKLDEDTARALAGLDVVEMTGGAEISEEGIKVLESWVKKIKPANKIDALRLLAQQLMLREAQAANSEAPFNLTINLTQPPPKPKQLPPRAYKPANDELPTIKL